jgi:hypothetical protein
MQPSLACEDASHSASQLNLHTSFKQSFILKFTTAIHQTATTDTAILSTLSHFI